MEKAKVFKIIPALVDTEMTKGRGKSKISPDQLPDELFQSFQKNNCEAGMGKVKWLKIIKRISPVIAKQIMKN